MKSLLESIARQLTDLQADMQAVLAEVRALKKPKHRQPNPDGSQAAAWIGAKKLMDAFSAAFPDTYRISGPRNRNTELRAAKELLASGETVQGLIELAKHNAEAEFEGNRAQSANLVLLQKNLSAIKVRKFGLIRPASKTYVPRQASAGEQEGEWDYVNER